jgi:aldose 1-epimerase
MVRVTLRHGDSEVALAPEIGGSILSWTDRGTPILRPPLPNSLDLSLVRSLGGYPLVPFSNRIARGEFIFDGAHYELPPMSGGNALHGVGWKRAWTVARATANSAMLRLDHAPDELWPFAFLAEQDFAIGNSGLSWRMRLTNLHSGPAPAGIGFHPYLPRGDGVTLHFHADGVWFNGPDSIPFRHGPVPFEWNHSAGRRVGSTILDNCFTGWRGPAVLEYATHRVSIAADPVFRFCVAFTPEDKDFFAVEPVSHMNDGVNRMGGDTDHGVAVLQQGETLSGEMRMQVAWS